MIPPPRRCGSPNQILPHRRSPSLSDQPPGGEKGKAVNMVSLVSREGRQLQRYSKNGSRLVVGCIPYKFNPGEEADKSMEVLVISSPKGNGLLFPKGGWEIDETIKEAATREAMEEAGVQGNIERTLGKWTYKSRTYDAYYEGIMFPLSVTQELGDWPEMHTRERKWVSVAEAKEGCQHPWMKEALERLVKRLSNSSRNTVPQTC